MTSHITARVRCWNWSAETVRACHSTWSATSNKTAAITGMKMKHSIAWRLRMTRTHVQVKLDLKQVKIGL